MSISNLSSNSRPGICTSTTRPSNPYEGQLIYETDTDDVMVWNGSAWRFMSVPQSTEPGSWVTYTSWGITQPGSVGGLTYDYSKYSVNNKTVTWVANVLIPSGSAGISGNHIVVNGLPITAVNMGSIIGSFYYLESGVRHRAGTIVGFNTTTMKLYCDGDGAEYGSSYAIKAGDRLRFNVTWEIA